MPTKQKFLPENVATSWLHLLKKTLIRYPLDAADLEMARDLSEVDSVQRREIERWIELNRQGQLQESGADLASRAAGQDWPATAETMIGLFRMDNLHSCLLDVLRRNVPGDVAEVGVWRGGAGIMMRAVLKAFGSSRSVWLADSFQGLPRPDPERYPADSGDVHWSHSELVISADTVKQNFQRYGLLDDQVKFLAGWFHDTLAEAPVRRLALLHLDCDMYQSTIVALRALYPKVSPGGFVIVDDFGALPPCRQAVMDFRDEFKINAEMRQVDWTGVFWQVPAVVAKPPRRKKTRPIS